MLALAPIPRAVEPRKAAPVRVAFVIDQLSRAGTESQLLALLRTLDPRVVEPSLVLLDGTSAESRALEPTNCEVLRLGIRKLVSGSAARAARTLWREWRRTRPNVVQAYFMDSAYFTVPIAKLAGIPRIVRVRNNLGYWLTRKHRLLGNLLRPCVNVTLTNTEAGRDQLVTAERLAPNKVAVIENGVDLERFALRSSRAESGVVRIGAVANLRPVKNIDGLMRAAKIVLEQFPNAQFEVAGDGEQRAELEKLHAEMQLGNRFVLRGSVQNIPEFLASLDVAVLPSHSEGMSNALLEYMAAGCAIVATEVGANSRIISNELHGLLVPPNDVAALASAMLRLLQSPASAMRMADTAREHVEHHFSRDAMRLRFEQFYVNLARGSHRG